MPMHDRDLRVGVRTETVTLLRKRDSQRLKDGALLRRILILGFSLAGALSILAYAAPQVPIVNSSEPIYVPPARSFEGNPATPIEPLRILQQYSVR
jgi:hypothetical protein